MRVRLRFLTFMIPLLEAGRIGQVVFGAITKDKSRRRWLSIG